MEHKSGKPSAPEDVAVEPRKEEENDVPRKRRRRSGWDAPAPTAATTPAAAAAAAAAEVVAPTVENAHACAVAPTRTLIDPIAAQKLAFQKAQEILAISGLGGAASSPAIALVNPVSVISNRVYVGSLHYSVTEVEIRTIFGSIGPIRTIDMSFDPATQRSKGYCFVDFENAADAQAAMGMNGVEIAGRPVRDA